MLYYKNNYNQNISFPFVKPDKMKLSRCPLVSDISIQVNPMSNSSLMSRTAATLPSANTGKLLSQLRDALAPSVSSLSLEERLEKLTPEQRQQVLTFAQLARTMASIEVAFKGYSTESYLDMVRKVYRGGNLMMQQLIADVLE